MKLLPKKVGLILFLGWLVSCLSIVIFSYLIHKDEKTKAVRLSLKSSGEFVSESVSFDLKLGDQNALFGRLNLLQKLIPESIIAIRDKENEEVIVVPLGATLNQCDKRFYSAQDIVYSNEKLGELHICDNRELTVMSKSEWISLAIVSISMGLVYLLLFGLFKKMSRSVDRIFDEMDGLLNLRKTDVFRRFSYDEEAVSAYIQLLKEAKNRGENEFQKNLINQVAHDIRSPLSAIKLFQSDIESHDSKRGKVFSSAIRRIEGITDVLKNDYDESIIPFDAVAVLTELLNEKSVEYPSVNISSEMLIDQCMLSSIAQEDLKRVLSNTINNSVEAFSDLDLAKLYIEVEVSKIEERFCVSVIDNSGGFEIPVEKAIEKKLSTKEGNSGLGLWHCIVTVERAGGKVNILGKHNSGSKIEIILPI